MDNLSFDIELRQDGGGLHIQSTNPTWTDILATLTANDLFETRVYEEYPEEDPTEQLVADAKHYDAIITNTTTGLSVNVKACFIDVRISNFGGMQSMFLCENLSDLNDEALLTCRIDSLVGTDLPTWQDDYAGIHGPLYEGLMLNVSINLTLSDDEEEKKMDNNFVNVSPETDINKMLYLLECSINGKTVETPVYYPDYKASMAKIAYGAEYEALDPNQYPSVAESIEYILKHYTVTLTPANEETPGGE